MGSVKIDPREYECIPENAEHAYFQTYEHNVILTYTVATSGRGGWKSIVMSKGDVRHVTNVHYTFGVACGAAKRWITKNARMSA